MKKALPRGSYVQERGLARWEPGLFSEELRSLQRKLDVTRVVSPRVFQGAQKEGLNSSYYTEQSGLT